MAQHTQTVYAQLRQSVVYRLWCLLKRENLTSNRLWSTSKQVMTHSFTYKLTNMFFCGAFTFSTQECDRRCTGRKNMVLLLFTRHQKFPLHFPSQTSLEVVQRESVWVLMINFTCDVPSWLHGGACSYQDFGKLSILQSRYGIDGDRHEILCYAPPLLFVEEQSIVTGPACWLLHDKSTFSHNIFTEVGRGSASCPALNIIQ